MINILLIDTVIQKYDFNILENYPLNSLYSGILNLIENTNDIHYFVLNNNSYKSEYHYNNNISFINIGNSINSIKEQIIDLNNKYNFKIIISINYPILISKLKENTSFINQDKLNNFIEKNLNILYTTLSSSSKLYVDNFWVHYNKIIGVTNYQINNLITRFGNKDKFYLVKSMYNKYINNICCKAIDNAYNTQPEKPEQIWNMRGLNNNSWHKVYINKKTIPLKVIQYII